MEEKSKIITELSSLKTEQQLTFYNLQKKEEDLMSIKAEKLEIEAKLTDAECKNKSLSKMLEENRRDGDNTSKELALTKSRLSSLEKRQVQDSKEITELREVNKTHVAQIKQLQCGQNQRQQHNTNDPGTASDIYEVERIVSHKMKNKKRYFLIQWKGFDKTGNTWEPESNLLCPGILQNFKKANNLK